MHLDLIKLLFVIQYLCICICLCETWVSVCARMRVVVCSVVYVSLAACCSVVSAEHCLAEQRAELPYTLQIQTTHHIRWGKERVEDGKDRVRTKAAENGVKRKEKRERRSSTRKDELRQRD